MHFALHCDIHRSISHYISYGSFPSFGRKESEGVCQTPFFGISLFARECREFYWNRRRRTSARQEDCIIEESSEHEGEEENKAGKEDEEEEGGRYQAESAKGRSQKNISEFPHF